MDIESVLKSSIGERESVLEFHWGEGERERESQR